jgi:hypothetical protein
MLAAQASPAAQHTPPQRGWPVGQVVLGGGQPSSTMPLQLSSRPLAQTSAVAGRTSLMQPPQVVLTPSAPRTQGWVPERQMPTDWVPAGPV